MKRAPQLILGLLLAVASTASWSADVVKIMNFSCPICRASESLDDSIRSAAAETGGKLVAAPVPASETTGARERIYYASRLQGDAVEQNVRTSLFKGAQDMDAPFEDNAQTVAWLEDDLTPKGVRVDWARLSRDADAPDASGALGRAARLALKAGAQGLPTYIVMKNNRIVGAFDPRSVGSNSLISLRDAVVAAVHKADGEQKN